MMKSFYFNLLRTHCITSPCQKCRLLSTEKRPSTEKRKKIFSLKDPQKAEEIAKLILKNRKYKNSLFIESNPGEGMLTTALLKGNTKIISYVCFEEREKYVKYLNVIRKKRKDDILIVKHLKNHTGDYDKQEEKVLKTASESLKIKCMTFIGQTPYSYSDSAIYHLLDKIKADNSIFQHISPEYFFFSLPQFYRKILNLKRENKKSSEYKALAVIMDVFFDIKCIAEIPFTSFSPVIPKRKQKFREIRHDDTVVTDEKEYLLHMVPRLDMIRAVDNHANLIFFLKQILHTPKERIIPKMENWMSDSGVHLIRMGISMLDRIIDMSPQQLLQIYKDMQTWPGFEQSFFYSMFNQLNEDSDGKTKSLITHEEESSELIEWKDDDEDVHVDDEGDLGPV